MLWIPARWGDWNRRGLVDVTRFQRSACRYAEKTCGASKPLWAKCPQSAGHCQLGDWWAERTRRSTRTPQNDPHCSDGAARNCGREMGTPRRTVPVVNPIRRETAVKRSVDLDPGRRLFAGGDGRCRFDAPVSVCRHAILECEQQQRAWLWQCFLGTVGPPTRQAARRS